MPRESNSDSPKTTRLQRAAPIRMRLASMAESRESNPVAPYLTLAALAVRWLTVRLALDEIWRKMKESNPAGSAPAHGFQDRLATIHRHFRMSKNVMVAKERVELSYPKASVSKTDAYPGSATWPWRTPWESNPPWTGLQSAA
jgi:hypothetical protein